MHLFVFIHKLQCIYLLYSQPTNPDVTVEASGLIRGLEFRSAQVVNIYMPFPSLSHLVLVLDPKTHFYMEYVTNLHLGEFSYNDIS